MTGSVLPATGEKSAARARGKKIWTHFMFLVGLAAILYVVARAVAGGPGGLSSALSGLPRFLFSVLPIAAGLAAGASSFSRPALRQAVRIALVAPLLMLFFESGVGPRLQPTPGAGPQADSIAGEQAIVDRAGSIGILAGLLREGDIAEATRPTQRYGFGHPRVLLAEALKRLLALLLPGILMGLAIGIAAWMHARVRFVSPVDGRFAQLLVAWTVIPLAWTVIDGWTVITGFTVLFEGGSMAVLLIPYLAFGLLAALGWRSASRTSRTSES